MLLRTILLLLAAILLAAGAGAVKTFVAALKKEEVMTGGRRVSTLVTKQRDPGRYWVSISFNGVVAVGLFGLGVGMVWLALRKKK